MGSGTSHFYSFFFFFFFFCFVLFFVVFFFFACFFFVVVSYMIWQGVEFWYDYYGLGQAQANKSSAVSTLSARRREKAAFLLQRNRLYYR